MPRRREVPKREVLPDPKYRETDVSKFINVVMLHGKKAVAEGIVYGAFEYIETNAKKSPLDVFQQALANCKPAVEVKSRRVGGAIYQVPVEVKTHRANTLAMRWLVQYARQRREKTMTERLMNEILDASNGLGAAVKRREDTHNMAESNKAFAHYRWYSSSIRRVWRSPYLADDLFHQLVTFGGHRGTRRAHRPE